MRHDKFNPKDAWKEAGLEESLLDESVLDHALRSLPARVPPVGLTTRLRVTASHERKRRQQRSIWRPALTKWYERTCMAANEVMRPLALPFAGGVVSAIVLFSAWLVPTYPLQAKASSTADVPTILSTEATLKGAVPVGLSRGDVVVEVTVDDEGRMADYDIVSGAVALQDATVCQRLEHFLTYSEFVPATAFGQPTAGKVRVPISASQLRDARGTTFLIALKD